MLKWNPLKMITHFLIFVKKYLVYLNFSSDSSFQFNNIFFGNHRLQKKSQFDAGQCAFLTRFMVNWIKQDFQRIQSINLYKHFFTHQWWPFVAWLNLLAARPAIGIYPLSYLLNLKYNKIILLKLMECVSECPWNI